MDNNEQKQEKRPGSVDFVNSATSFLGNVIKNIPVIGSATNITPPNLGSPGGIMAWFGRQSYLAWGFIGIGIMFFLLILFGIVADVSVTNMLGLTGGSGQQENTTPPPPGPGAICGSTGSLDYSAPIHDVSVLPQDPESIKQQVLSTWPNAQIGSWDHIVQRSVAAGWNPSFILTLWIEESGAQGANGYTDALGCDPSHPTTDIDKSLDCVFNSFRDPSLTFEDFMCIYGGDQFNKSPCTFVDHNPNFPGNVKNWYSKIAGSTGSPEVLECKPADQFAQGNWPTSGILTQGPLGAFDHADLKSRTGWDSIDVGSEGGTNPPIYSSFAGTVTDAHSCVIDNTCSVHYGNYVIVNNGSFSTMYGHLSQLRVSTGQQVSAGEMLGIMGTTGNSTGVHLHWEFRGAPMSPPNVPQAITPADCDYPNKPCAPVRIAPDPGV